MPISKRELSIQTLLSTNWQSIFNQDNERTSLAFRKDHCVEFTSTIPYYFDATVLEQELARISEGHPETTLVPFSEQGGTARMAVQDEWLKLILLPTDWMFAEKREVEVQWIAGKEKHVNNRYRRHDTSQRLEGQIPANYWGNGRLRSAETVFTVSRPFPVHVVHCQVVMHVEDENGIATNNASITDHEMVVGQLANGIVLWWHGIDSNCQIKIEGEHVNIDGKLVHIVTGAGSECLPHYYRSL